MPLPGFPSPPGPPPPTLEVPSVYHVTRTTVIKRVILHAIAEFIRAPESDTASATGVATRWLTRFCTDHLHHSRLSVHVIVLPDGRLIKCVPVHRMAHHALGHNADSVGLEFAVPGVHTYDTFLKAMRTPGWTTNTQILTAQRWLTLILRDHGLTTDAVVTHAAVDPARKEDPGVGFPLAGFLAGITAALGATS